MKIIANTATQRLPYLDLLKANWRICAIAGLAFVLAQSTLSASAVKITNPIAWLLSVVPLLLIFILSLSVKKNSRAYVRSGLLSWGFSLIIFLIADQLHYANELLSYVGKFVGYENVSATDLVLSLFYALAGCLVTAIAGLLRVLLRAKLSAADKTAILTGTDFAMAFCVNVSLFFVFVYSPVRFLF